MILTYTPIKHNLSTLHSWLEHIVKNVWCQANAGTDYQTLLTPELYKFSRKAHVFRENIRLVYDLCINLTLQERNTIIEVFDNNNNIEELCCNPTFHPIGMNNIRPDVLAAIQNTLSTYYTNTLECDGVPGTKLDYYQSLKGLVSFKFCPCCGLNRIKSKKSNKREDFDHYFPKSRFPFACVNLLNLVPMCSECNSDSKKTYSPLDISNVAFFPYDGNRAPLEISYTLENITFDLDTLTLTDEINFNYMENPIEQVLSWNHMFKITDRFCDLVIDDSKVWLDDLKSLSLREPDLSINQCIVKLIDANDDMPYYEARFLKKSFYVELLKNMTWIETLDEDRKSILN